MVSARLSARWYANLSSDAVYRIKPPLRRNNIKPSPGWQRASQPLEESRYLRNPGGRNHLAASSLYEVDGGGGGGIRCAGDFAACHSNPWMGGESQRRLVAEAGLGGATETPWAVACFNSAPLERAATER